MTTKKTLTRSDAIQALRHQLLHLVDEEHCMCDVAARLNIFCKGFHRLSDPELREKYYWIAGPRPKISRDNLEELVNVYKLARQEATEMPLTCDVEQLVDGDSCAGWDEHNDEDLARYYQEILGTEVEVVPDPETKSTEA